MFLNSTVVRKCPTAPPTPYMFMDFSWPFEDRRLGSKATYKCPHRTMSSHMNMTGEWKTVFKKNG